MSKIKKARIQKLCKSAMQSADKNKDRWTLEFMAGDTNYIDPVMGWTSNTDTDTAQVKLTFESIESAERYAKKAGIQYIIEKNNEESGAEKPKSYIKNFN